MHPTVARPGLNGEEMAVAVQPGANYMQKLSGRAEDVGTQDEAELGGLQYAKTLHLNRQ